MESIALEMELIALGVESIALEVESIALEVELIALEVELIALAVELIALEVELIALEVELIALEVELIALRVELIALRVELIANLHQFIADLHPLSRKCAIIDCRNDPEFSKAISDCGLIDTPRSQILSRKTTERKQVEHVLSDGRIISYLIGTSFPRFECSVIRGRLSGAIGLHPDFHLIGQDHVAIALK